jgi:4-hydroxy-tetrahydrodipicolinate synthase
MTGRDSDSISWKKKWSGIRAFAPRAQVFMYRGLYPILHTPFDGNGEVDHDSMRRLVRHVRDAGVEEIVYPGFVSEWWRLTDDEILTCAEHIGRPFIGVVTPQAVVPAVRRMRDLERMGADAMMLLPAFVLGGPATVHLNALMAQTSLPCIVQDSAGLTGIHLDPRALAALARKNSNLKAIKVDQVPTGSAISALRAEPALRDLSYFAGYSGVQWRDASRRGATALMSGCGHIAADRRMLNDPSEYRRLLPLLSFEMQTIDFVIAVHKRLLFEAGVIDTPELRVASPLDATHLEELQILQSELLPA